LSGANMWDITSITIRLNRLPPDITTRDIHLSLVRYNLFLTRIEIFENDDGQSVGSANVTIDPPPNMWPPWPGPAESLDIYKADGSSVRVPVQVQRVNRYDDWIKTPLGKDVPRQINLPTDQLLLCMMAKEDTMLKMPQNEYQTVRMAVQFFRRYIEISFRLDIWGKTGPQNLKIPIKFSHIKKIVRIKQDDGTWALLIQLPSPPEIFSRPDSVAYSHDDQLSVWQERDTWMRQLEITNQIAHATQPCASTAPAKLHKEYRTVDVGRWTNYFLRLPTNLEDLWMRCERHLTDYNVKIEEGHGFTMVEPGQTTAWTLLDSSAPRTTMEWLNMSRVHLPFEVRYQLEACISQGLLNEYNIDAEFLAKLNSFDIDRARMMLEGIADHNVPYYKPISMFEDPKILYYWPTAKVPAHAAMVRKAVVTPTAIYFKTPSVELTNRILRQYSDLTDRFLRVQFTDELTFGKIWSDQGSSKSDELYTRVLRVLLNGIVIGDRHYKVLAWSNSQFREHGAFFFCATDHVTCESIREWMGDLKHIRSVGKFAARMGQCFTTTRQVSGISVPKIVPVSDIERQKDGKLWNFTDGIGKISMFNARMVALEQDLVDVPSCFQVRMGGCKGVLVVWPDVPPKEVHIRPSQQKFLAPYNGLEIIKVSKFSQATLNTQIIPILNCLGVQDKVFLELLEEELKEYEEALTSATKASGLLQQRVDENQITLVISEMVKVFMDSNEPFLWTLLRLWRCWALQRLKQKAAIGVSKSAFLYGCVDELGVLRGHSKDTEGRGKRDEHSLPQIFLQVPKEGSDPNNDTNYRVVEGLCVVGRNPSLHPGDIRVVQAIDAPGLRHLKNVVVFPQRGDRDIPSMCSGGDLDGDDFFVIWDQRLLPKEWNFPPMDHDTESATPGLDGSQDITINQMCAFYAQYMKNDSLGLIATAHKAWADKIGPKHPKCLELAKFHSLAVDYVKSGTPAVMHRSLNPKSFPHFMERERNSYKSNRPLGRIYDRVNIEVFSPAYEMEFDERILSRFQHSDEELEKAGKVKAKYDVAMLRLMGQHERPISEFEVWSTFVLSRPRVGNDYKLQEVIGREVSALKERFRVACVEAVTGVDHKSAIFSHSDIDLENLDRFVAAMYKVTYNEVQATLARRSMPVLNEEGQGVTGGQGPDSHMPLISFPWLFHRELARIATGGQPVTRKWFGTSGDAEKAQKSVHEDIKDEQGTGTGEQKVTDKKQGAEDEHVARTVSGKILHRGDILDLFDE
ncbi:Sad1 RNA-dependent RNA polymerase, partial [Cryphonectria parasitica EP155]